MVMEKILFNKLIGKSRWFLLIVSLLIQEALKLETKMEWGRKKKNYRNMRYTAFLFVNDFVLRNCVKTHQNICSFKITIIEGKIKLNLRKEAVVLLKAIKSSSLKNPINKPNIQNSLIEVGKQKHVGITYITEKNDEITFGSTQTTKKIFYIQKSKFCTEKHNKNAPLRYPRTADEILGLKDYEQGKDDQYVVHSHIIGESVRPIEILRNEDLSSIEFKARCLKALQILKKKEEEDLINKRIQEIEESIIGKLGTENLQLLKNQINLPRKNKFLIQHAAPNQGEVVDEEDLLKRLSIREQDFIYNATMLSLELKNYLEDLEGYEKIITIDQTHDYIENLDTNDFYELLIDANLSDLSEN